MKSDKKLFIYLTLRAASWVAIVVITYRLFGPWAACIWPLLAFQHRLGKYIDNK